MLDALSLENRFHVIMMLIAILFLMTLGLIVIVLLFRAWIGHNARQSNTKPREPTDLTDAWDAASKRMTDHDVQNQLDIQDDRGNRGDDDHI